MGFFDRFFRRKKKQAAPEDAAPAAPAPADPAKDPNMIRVYDGYGRELFITKQTWRDSVLSGHLKTVWNDPNALYSTIVQSLQDGFSAEMVEPAEHLAKIDADAERSAVILAIVYREQKRAGDAETILNRYVASHGESGAILTNLAKVYSDRGETERSMRTLWRALELDPNQDNALGWYEAVFREREGAAAGIEALRRIAALPVSWRARLWLARDALQRRELEEALVLYDEALSLAPRPVPADLLAQMSGDLGNHAHLPELLKLTMPHFDIALHGLQVGNNLIKANLDLGRLDEAQALIDLHYAQKRHDWQATLAFWDAEMAKIRVDVSPRGEELPPVSMLSIVGPVWLRERSPTIELFPAKASDAPVVCVLGATAELPGEREIAKSELPDLAGRASRSIPLFVVEQLFFRTEAVTKLLQPFVQSDEGAFALTTSPWSDEDASTFSRNSEPPADYALTCHLVASSTPWTVSLRLLQTIDAKLLATASVRIEPKSPETGYRDLCDVAVRLLREHAGVEPTPPPLGYFVPREESFAPYQLRLEQALAVCANTTREGRPGFLGSEREIINGMIQLCLEHPQNVTTRILLAETLNQLRKSRPQVVAEFQEKVSLLQTEKPLPEPSQGVLQRMFNQTFAAPRR